MLGLLAILVNSTRVPFLTHLMPVLLQYGVLYDGLLVVGDLVGIDHVVEDELCDVVQICGGHVQADGAVQQHRPQLEERVQ